MGSKKKKAGWGFVLTVIIVGLPIASDFLFGWPNIRHYFKAPGPVYGVQANEALSDVLEKSKITKKLEDYRFYVVESALKAPIKKGRYEGKENYKWRVSEMYISFVENILSRNEHFEYHIDRSKKKIFIWPKGHFSKL